MNATVVTTFGRGVFVAFESGAGVGSCFECPSNVFDMGFSFKFPVAYPFTVVAGRQPVLQYNLDQFVQRHPRRRAVRDRARDLELAAQPLPLTAGGALTQSVAVLGAFEAHREQADLLVRPNG